MTSKKCWIPLKGGHFFLNVSINTLLDSPRQLICQCCEMLLGDSTISKEVNGDYNEEYCKWCYADGNFTYKSKEQLIEFCVENMANEKVLKKWKNEINKF